MGELVLKLGGEGASKEVSCQFMRMAAEMARW